MSEEPPRPPTIAVSAVRAQLERVLDSGPMRNSKRCQSLLRYVVEAAIEGRFDTVKERTIGVEVFGRGPGYDTNEDSVVRHAAVEVRKRLAQYYLDHEHELRIVLPQGGYVPEFRPPAPEGSAEAPVRARATRGRARAWWALAATAVAVGAGLAYWRPSAPSPLELFWAPVLKDRASVVVSVGQPTRVYNFGGSRSAELDARMVGLGSTPPEQAEALKRTTLTLDELAPAGKRYLFLGDSLCLLKVTTLLASHGKAYVVRGVEATAFQDLRGSPAVLIGLHNNRWTVGLVGNLRFYFARDAGGNDELHDRQHDDRPRWSRPLMAGDESVTEDYAIVTRVVDASTEETVISAAGLRHFGTLAAGDFLTSEAYMSEAFREAPPGWHRKNIQVVLNTHMVGGATGPPRVVATHFW